MNSSRNSKGKPKTDFVALTDQLLKDLVENNGFFKTVRAGKFTIAHAMQFLKNTELLVRETPVHLQRAIAVAQKKKLPQLLDTFQHIYEEEKDHFVWAERDQKKIKSQHGAISTQELPALKALISWVQAQTDINPGRLLVYAFFIEYMTVKIGPSTLKGIHESSQIDPSYFSIVSNHVALDEHHAEEATQNLDLLVSAGILSTSEVRDMLMQSQAKYGAFIEAIVSDRSWKQNAA